jgi:ribonuclease P protein component
MFTLPKSERLKSKTAISALMTKGRWGYTSALKYCYIWKDDAEPNRIMVSVPKRFFKQAVRRNLLKRRLREAYRVRKDLVSGIDILFLYNTGEILSQEEIGKQVEDILHGLENEDK